MSLSESPNHATQPLARPQAAPIANLLQEAKQGPPSAVGRVLETAHRYLLLVANRELDHDLRQRVPASDLVQDTLTEAWQAFDRFSGNSEADLLAWLRRILLNNLANAQNRHRHTAKRDINREVPLAYDPRSKGFGAQLPAEDPSPSASAVALEECERMFRSLDQLPAHYAQVVRLRNLDYLPFADIAERMGLSADAARKLWERAIKQLANDLGPSDVER